MLALVLVLARGGAGAGADACWCWCWCEQVALLVGFEIVTNKRAVEKHYFAREFQLVQWTMGVRLAFPCSPPAARAVHRSCSSRFCVSGLGFRV